VALTVTLLVATLAWRIVAAVTEGSGAARRARGSLDREVNAHRWLARTLGSLEVGAPGAPGFDGAEHRMTFAAWLEMPQGWLEPGPVTIGVEDHVLVAHASSERVVLKHDVAGLDLDYLLESGAESRWARRWSSPTSAPLAVRLRVACLVSGVRRVDTLLYRIGERG
jgi:hypothetical protein